MDCPQCGKELEVFADADGVMITEQCDCGKKWVHPKWSSGWVEIHVFQKMVKEWK